MRTYPAKLLFFGEHVLLLGAPALSVPAPAFSGQWEVASVKADVRGLQMRLPEFAASDLLNDLPGIDAAQLKKDLLLGLFFRSNIPVGYGLGSSGALCAAVYDRYCRKKTTDLAELKHLFAHLESFFHGASSGIDPLTSYVKKPLLIRNKSEVSLAAPAAWEQGPVVFLLDTNQVRQTGPLVQWFLEKSREAEFAGRLEREFLPAHGDMVRAWLAADPVAFWENVRRVSRFQFEHFDPMIPASVRELWRETLDDRDVVLKVCGAGGGGFILGFARDRAAAGRIAGPFRLVFPFPEPSVLTP